MTWGMERPKGIRELALMVGVSASTISRALADSPRVSARTRERIQTLAREHGFQLNQTASAFRRQRTQSIGVVLPLGHETSQHLSDPFFMSLIAPLADAISEQGYDLLLSRVIPKDDRWLSALATSRRVDGLLVIGQSDQIDVIERTATTGVPMVVWGDRRSDLSQIIVGTDNAMGGRFAARHLIGRGRKRLAFLGNPSVPEFAARLAGFEQEIATSGRHLGVTTLPIHLTTEESYEGIAEFLSGNPPPDGIFCASDVIAMSTLRALLENGVSVPRDTSVIGFDDISVAVRTAPPLTTIRQDVERGAKAMVDLLMRQLAGETVASLSMEPELVVRGSS